MVTRENLDLETLGSSPSSPATHQGYSLDFLFK